jgi:hypothetical protein
MLGKLARWTAGALAATLFLAPTSGLAAATVTPATGGTGLTVDVLPPLTGPTIAEATAGDIGTGTIVLQAPTGFQFATTPNSVTATVSQAGGTCQGTSRVLKLAGGLTTQPVTPTTTTITITVTQGTASQGNCRSQIVWSGIQVQATQAGNGNITKSATSGSTISGVTNGATNFGSLSATVLIPTDTGSSTSTSGAQATPELDSIILFAAGGLALAGFSYVQRRRRLESARRNEPQQ